MAKIVYILGKPFIIKQVKKPEYFKKELILSRPAPWVFDKSKLSPAQVKAIIQFAETSMKTRNRPILERRAMIRASLKGRVTGLAKPIVRIRGMKDILPLADTYGVSVSPEVRGLAERPFVEIDRATKRIKGEYATPPAGVKLPAKEEVIAPTLRA